MTLVVFTLSLAGAMALGMPSAVALLASAIALMIQLGLFDPQILAENLVNGANSFPLLAIPFFMLAGELMNAGGMSRRIVHLAMTLVGHLRGGLGYVTIVAALLMASVSGSAVADTAALTALLLPMMAHAGYDRGRAGGLIAAGAVIAPVIPPSIAFVVFGVATHTSIGKLFLAGIVPGLLMAVSLVLAWWWTVRRELRAPQPQRSGADRSAAARDAVWALMLPVIIVGGLKFGIFTPTEAGVVAAVYALFVGVMVYRELRLRDLYVVFAQAARMTAVVMFLVAAAMVVGWLVAVADLPGQLAGLLGPLMQSPTLLLLFIMVILIVVGTAMDAVPTTLILAPILMPVVKQAGIDPIHFGVLFVINTSIGLITPPVGSVLNVVAGVGRMRLDDVVRGVLPFMLAEFGVMFLLALFPEIVLAPLRWLSG